MPQMMYRWGLVDGKLPLYERHMRSLLVHGLGVPSQAWVRSRVEWSLDNLDPALKYGVVVISVDDDGMVDVRVEPGREKLVLGYDGSVLGGEADVLSDGQFWSSDGDAYMHYGPAIDASSTLARDLAKTLHHSVEEGPAPDAAMFPAESAPEGHCERFFVSDEYGVVPLGDEPGAATREMTGYFEKLKRGIEDPSQRAS